MPKNISARPGEPPALPDYLLQTYSWAYVTPRAVRRFERQWLLNLILWGNFARLRDAALTCLGERLQGRSLQIACVYGDLTARFAARHERQEQLDVIDVLPIQLDNLRRKLGPASKVGLHLANSAELPMPTASYERALLFFLLHEQPLPVRLQTIRQAFRVVKPGGKIVLVDYHRPPRLHPLHAVMALVFKALEPYALDLWRTPLDAWWPADMPPAQVTRRTCFGGLYQIVEVIR